MQGITCTILSHVQIITIGTIGGDFTMSIFTYYAGIILDVFLYLLCSKLCQQRHSADSHIWYQVEPFSDITHITDTSMPDLISQLCGEL